MDFQEAIYCVLWFVVVVFHKIMRMQTIDIHTHGIAGFDTRSKDTDAILKIAEIQASYRVDAIIPTIYSAPIHIMRENMAIVKMAMDMQKAHHKKPILVASIIGVHLEGPFLNPSYCGALDHCSFLEPDIKTFEELVDGFEDMVRIITIAPELDGSTKIIKNARDKGVKVGMGHSNATYAEAEAGYNAGAESITHIFNAMRGIHHREPGIAGFGLLHAGVYTEVIADPYHLHPETIKLIFRVKNHSRIIIISDSIRDTNCTRFPDGKQNMADSNGFKITPSQRNGILQGGSMTITESTQRLVGMGIDAKTVRRCITENPATYLDIDEKSICA